MGDRYVLLEADNGDWWVIDTALPHDHPKKIISAHSQKEAAESTVTYQNSLPDDHPSHTIVSPVNP